LRGKADPHEMLARRPPLPAPLPLAMPNLCTPERRGMLKRVAPFLGWRNPFRPLNL